MKAFAKAPRIKRIVIAAIALTLVFAFAGCGGARGEAPAGGNGSADAPVSPGSPDTDTAATVRIDAGGAVFTAELADNAAARAFAALLPLTLDMSAMAHEKYFDLPVGLPVDDYRPGTIAAGDIMLWNANCLVLFYETFSTSYSYTRIGKVRDATGLASALGTGGVTVSFSVSA